MTRLPLACEVTFRREQRGDIWPRRRAVRRFGAVASRLLVRVRALHCVVGAVRSPPWPCFSSSSQRCMPPARNLQIGT
eukprot:6178813-Pleurochrysis_carterae.AAC.3